MTVQVFLFAAGLLTLAMGCFALVLWAMERWASGKTHAVPTRPAHPLLSGARVLFAFALLEYLMGYPAWGAFLLSLPLWWMFLDWYSENPPYLRNGPLHLADEMEHRRQETLGEKPHPRRPIAGMFS